MGFNHLLKPLSRLLRSRPDAPAPLPGRPAAEGAAAPGRAGAAPAAATGNLADGDALRALAGLIDSTDATASVPTADLTRVARQRIAQLIDAGQIDFAELAATPGVRESALVSVAGLCEDSAHLAQAFALLHDAQEICRLVSEGSSSRVRQFAALRMEEPAALKKLLKQTRDKDKSVYRIIKQKCDALRTEELQAARLDAAVTALCAALERHGQRLYDPLYPTSLKLFEEEWHSLEPHATTPFKERAGAAIERCREVVSAHARQAAERSAEDAHRAAVHAAREAADAAAARESQQHHEMATLAAAEAARARAAEERLRAERIAAESQALRQIAGLIAKAQGALREGSTGRAAGLRRAIDQKLATATAVPAFLAGQVHKLDDALNELRGWKEHAVAPKRAQLIAEMEALIGSSQPPPALAARIKQLQEDWKTISKGLVSDAESDWQRFHQASQTAYLPCRDYFEAQSLLRRDNLAKRAAVLERLQAFDAAQGEHPDWRSVAAVLREAPLEWRRHAPVERGPARALQESFDAAFGRLQTRLDAWHAHNAAEKQSLIQKARALLDTADVREATEAAKRLQQRWQDLGAAGHEQERQLWELFRGHCDAIFQKRQRAQEEHAVDLAANKARAAALCETIEQITDMSGPALLAGAAQIPQWRGTFEAVGELPRADARTLERRFAQAIERCERKIEEMRESDRAQSLVNLLEAGRRIHAYRWALAQRAPPPERESLQQAAQAFIAGVARWPKGGEAALRAAWASAEATRASDAALADELPGARELAGAHDETVHHGALRMLCVRGEILAGRPTPPEDQALRREYQVQRLVQHMGRPGDAPADHWEALVLEWVLIGPIAPETHRALLQRFQGSG